MNVLLLYPRFPKTFWSFDQFMELAGLKAVIPPLGILTVAAMLPNDWNIRFCDRNVETERDEDWEWCDLVILSAMVAQKDDFHHLIQKGHRLGKKVAVGGPYPTSVPQPAVSLGADYLILDEGEITIPLFLEAIAQGQPSGTFRALEKPDVTQSPLPRFDLLNTDAYLMMAVQFSRGCPFQCEFCDIINLYGRKPRTKEPEQTLAELQTLYDLGWRGSVFMVDDNFIGNQRNVKRLLRQLIPWMEAHHYPFTFLTEASINLAEDDELMDLMAKAGFYGVFLGIETPDQDSLEATHKFQNIRQPLVEACHRINQAGLLIYAGFIIGFDGEQAGAGDRIQSFVEATSIPVAMLNLLQAMPNTALWQRLEQEGRLLNGRGFIETGDLSDLMNFIPTRPIEEIAREYLQTNWAVYDPVTYLKRCLRQCLNISSNPRLHQTFHFHLGKGLRIATQLMWRQGWQRAETRSLFWRQLLTLLWHKPRFLNVYFALLACGEHFWNYNELIHDRIIEKLGYDPLEKSHPEHESQCEEGLVIA
jgi:radical SAM superfamily enzyme YgiQ (UPF0313 family)